MLSSLRIQNLATIEDIEVDLEAGFSVLTGETGAGKSIIIESIKLVLGEKASADVIRTGKAHTAIEAIFHTSSDLPQMAELAMQVPQEFFIQRKITDKGHGKGYIEGTLVPVKKLRDIREHLVDIYGQNDHVFLRLKDNQLDYLDFFANAFPLRKAVGELAQKLRRLLRQQQELLRLSQDREQRQDFLRFQIKEIEEADLKPEEEDELRQERKILRNAEKIQHGLEEAIGLSYSQEGSLASMLAKLQAVVDKLADFDEEFKRAAQAISQFAISNTEFSDFLLKFRDKHVSSPGKLDEIESRLSQIESLKRKYGNNVPAILEFLGKAKKEFANLDLSQEKLTEVEEALDLTLRDYKQKAKNLSQKRKQAASALKQEVEREISALGMKKARFKVDIQPLTLDRSNLEHVKNTGLEEVEFLLSPNPGEDLKPLRKIASGGELSRFMLALKSINKNGEDNKTLVFDEVDAGIGGKTAELVAQKLKALSSHNQVICITHLPQIACYATHHYRIDKVIRKDRTFTTISKLSYQDRIEEIARLLAGSRVTQTTRQNAKEMLDHNQ